MKKNNQKKINTVVVTARSKNISLGQAWKMVTAIEDYPKNVEFVKKVKIYGTGLNSKFDNLTTIMWIPLTFKHYIISYKTNKEFSFKIPLGTGGYVIETYNLSEKSNSVEVAAQIKFDLNNKLLNTLLSRIIKYRQKKMLVATFKKFSNDIVY